MIYWRDDSWFGNDDCVISRRSSRPFQARRVVGLLALFLAMTIARLDGAEAAPPEQSQTALVLEPIHRVDGSNSTQRLVPRSYLKFEQIKPNGVAFHAVFTNEWPAGLVPIFEVERTNR